MLKKVAINIWKNFKFCKVFPFNINTLFSIKKREKNMQKLQY